MTPTSTRPNFSSRDGPIAWDGQSVLRREPPQWYLVVVGAVCEGRCGVYDTQTCELTLIAFRQGGQ